MGNFKLIIDFKEKPYYLNLYSLHLIPYTFYLLPTTYNLQRITYNLILILLTKTNDTPPNSSNRLRMSYIQIG